MNATPTNLNPVNPAQAQPGPGKQQDAATPDVPFSQVLSGEIARNGTETREDTEIDDGDAAQLPAVVDDSDAAQQLAAAIEAGARLALPAVDETAQKADVALQPDTLPQLPDVMPGLATPPDLMTQAPANSAAVEASADPAARRAAVPDARTVRIAANPQAEPPAAPVDAQQARPAVTVQADANATSAAATATAAATAFSERLAAARQSDPAMAGERIAELMSHPAMRTAAQAPLDAAPAADPASTRLAPSVGTTAWGQALGEKLVWMASGAQQTASLTLNPPNLGPLQVVLNVSNDQATASFFSAQPEVRQALESAFPKLREMMNEAGIQLGQATVSADTPRQNNTPERQGQRIAAEFMSTGNAAVATPQGMPVSAPRSGRGLVDTFA